MDPKQLKKLRDMQVAAFAAQTQLEMSLSTTAEPAHDFERDDLPAAFARKEAEVGAVLQLVSDVTAALSAAQEYHVAGGDGDTSQSTRAAQGAKAATTASTQK